MGQMAIDPFVNVKAIKELQTNALPNRKIIDMHMINNVAISSRKKNSELNFTNIIFDPKRINTIYNVVKV